MVKERDGAFPSRTGGDVEALLTADDVAMLLAVDRKRIYELAARWQPETMRLPSVKLGERQIRFRPRRRRALHQ